MKDEVAIVNGLSYYKWKLKHSTIFLAVMFFIMCLAGCKSSYILITSNKHHFPLDHSKIMAVAIVRDHTDSFRSHIEKTIVKDLTDLGYKATSSLDQFGPGGLAYLSQEETYLKLCDHGIDAVIVITLIDKNKDRQFQTRRSYTYPENYYYDRIWNYKNIQADLATVNSPQNTYFWEAILFNLSTLEPECTIQSASFNSIANQNETPFEKLLIKKMLKEKILKRQPGPPLKPF